MKPLAVDLFCGKGGWTIGLQAAGWNVIGFDIAADLTRDYPGHLVIQDVSTIEGRAMRGKVDLIVASPPCQEFSYMAMPWKRGKAIAAALRVQGEFPENYLGSRTVDELTALFRHCFRIAEEAQCPLVVENVKGAQPWVGRSAWSYGSYFLWGDVPALMPPVHGCIQKLPPEVSSSNQKMGRSPARWTNTAEHYLGSKKQPIWFNDDKRRAVKNGGDWFGSGESMSLMRSMSSKSNARREASALIAMIPFDLAYHIGQVFYPKELEKCS